MSDLDFEIQKIRENYRDEMKSLFNLSDEQDEKIFKLRKRISAVEKNILGFSRDTGDNGKEIEF